MDEPMFSDFILCDTTPGFLRRRMLPSNRYVKISKDSFPFLVHDVYVLAYNIDYYLTSFLLALNLDTGDLPLHLLARSGNATQTTIELLTRPIMDNTTICSYGGSQGVNLPLHIACQFRCKYDIIEGLLSAYGEAARIRRHSVRNVEKLPRGPRHKKPAEYGKEYYENLWNVFLDLIFYHFLQYLN